MIRPTVNLNGSAKESLIAEWRTVRTIAKELEVALRAAMPHGRDYADYADYTEARRVYRTLIQDVGNVSDHALGIRIAIEQQSRKK